MPATLSWGGDDDGVPPLDLLQPPSAGSRRSLGGGLPPEIEQAIWRGSDLGVKVGQVVSSGHAALDAELPGGGWPCHAVSEVLSPQPSVLEWRVIGPALAHIVATGGKIVIVGPPKTPHVPGLHHCGVDEKHLVWVQANAPSERLWCIEQLVRGGACGALVGWLPQARPEQIRRLQIGAQACAGPVFLFRPAAAQHEASAASLRVMASVALDWEVQVHVLKRRGPSHEGVVRLRSVPGGLESVLTPRLQAPSRLIAAREIARRGIAPSEGIHPAVQEVAAHAVGRTTSSAWVGQQPAVW